MHLGPHTSALRPRTLSAAALAALASAVAIAKTFSARLAAVWLANRSASAFALPAFMLSLLLKNTTAPGSKALREHLAIFSRLVRAPCASALAPTLDLAIN